MSRLLCITAHPDDEAGGFGGSLLLSRQRGVSTHVVCLTPGQAATHRGGASSGDELAAMRRKEFQASCAILRVSHGEVLDYADGALDKQDLLTVVGELARRIRQIRPQVVITLGPEGAVTGHPDHSMTSIFATLAFHWAGRANRFVDQLDREGVRPHRTQKLYYSTTAFTMPDRPPISPAPATTIIPIGPFLDAKISAFKAHTSQSPLFPFFESTLRQRGAEERFHLVATMKPAEMTSETDLFAGVVEDD
jgi:LmbE family N-acetylglucosaminyl deacetylase